MDKIFNKREYNLKYNFNYFRGKKGLIVKIYNTQIKSSKYRGHALPDYTRNELMDWIFNQSNFNKLYKNWINNGYSKNLVPSCDRLNYKNPYTLNNLRLVTWRENRNNWYKDVKEGRTHLTIPVFQYNLEGEFIKRYFSFSYASRKTGSCRENISACCNGRRKSTNGYVWRYT